MYISSLIIRYLDPLGYGGKPPVSAVGPSWRHMALNAGRLICSWSSLELEQQAFKKPIVYYGSCFAIPGDSHVVPVGYDLFSYSGFSATTQKGTL